METMTMEHDTITMSSVTIEPKVLASIQSLTVYAATKSEVTPILMGVKLTRVGDQLIVVATNRYVAVKAAYSGNVTFSDWDDDTTIWVDLDTLKQAATVSKANSLAMVTISEQDDNVVIAVGETRFTHVKTRGQYPPVERVFPEDDANGATTLSLNPKWLAALSKIVVPETRPSKDRPWSFQFWNGDNGKPRPTLATMSGEDYDIGVLIQPNLVVR